MRSTLGLHLGLTAFLAVTVAALALHRPTDPNPAHAASTHDEKQAVHRQSDPAARSSASADTVARLPRYPDIGSATDRRRAIVDALRAMGVPNDVLALVASQDFEVEWDRQFEACWGDPAKMERVQLEKDIGRDAAMRAALGEQGFKTWDTKTMLWEAMSSPVDVTPREAESIYALKKKLQQRQFELEQARMAGAMDRDQVIAAVQQAYATYNQELKSVLGGERYAKSQQLDDEFVAGNLRYELAPVNPSESQFQSLFQADKQFNQALAALSPGSPDYLDQFKAANEARDTEYARVLGADAFRNLREQEDSGVVQMKKYANLWNLDDGKIDQVYDTMTAYRKAVGDYQAQIASLQRLGQNVDWAAVNQYLQQLNGHAQQALQNAVGADSFSRLQQNGVLRWAGPGFRPVYGAGVPHH